MKKLLIIAAVALLAAACNEKTPVPITPVTPPAELVYTAPILKWNAMMDAILTTETHDHSATQENYVGTYLDNSMFAANVLVFNGKKVGGVDDPTSVCPEYDYFFKIEEGTLFRVATFVPLTWKSYLEKELKKEYTYRSKSETTGAELWSNRVDAAQNGETYTTVQVYTSPSDATTLVLEYMGYTEKSSTL